MNRWMKLLLVAAVLGGAWMAGTAQTAEAHRWGVAYVAPAPCYGPAYGYGYYYGPVRYRAYYAAPVVPVYPPVVPVPPVPPIPYPLFGPPVFFGW